jgi:hypothetical protein
MKRLALLSCIFGLLFTNIAISQEDTPAILPLTNVIVIDGTGSDLVPEMTVLIEGERIRDVFRTGTKPVFTGCGIIVYRIKPRRGRMFGVCYLRPGHPDRSISDPAALGIRECTLHVGNRGYS